MAKSWINTKAPPPFATGITAPQATCWQCQWAYDVRRKCMALKFTSSLCPEHGSEAIPEEPQ